MKAARAARLLLMGLVVAEPAAAQTTNQLFMTGTGSGNAPVIYTNGVDTNINLGIIPKGTGGVGIGTPTPNAIFDIYSPAATQNLFSVRNGMSSYLSINQYGSTYFIFGNPVIGWDNNLSVSALTSDTAPLFITSDGVGGSNDNINIIPSGTGRVGIGTTSPNALLDIGLNGTTTGNVRLEGATSGYVQLSPQAAAGSWTMTLPGSAGTSGQVLKTDGAGVTTWTSGLPGGVIGDARKAKMSIAAATTTGSFTADQIVVATALNGTMYNLPSYSQTINLGTTGAGGMDTGTAPASGFVSLYAIYNPVTPATSILACAVATSTASVYAGANMPSGYTASALIGIWPTDASKRLVAGLILNRDFQYQSYVSIFTGTTGVSSMTSQSISAGVPAAALTADIVLASTQTGGSVIYGIVSGDSTGTGAEMRSANLSSGGNTYCRGGLGSTYKGCGSYKAIPMITAQTVWWQDPNVNSGDAMFVQGYSF